MHGWARNHTEREWTEGYRLEPHTSDRAGGFWEPNRARQGDTEQKLLNRVAVLDALALPPRDPRFWNPRREAGWNNANPLWGHYIPEYGLGGDVQCVGQVEEHVRRPTLSSAQGPRGADFVAQRGRLGRRTTPLISYNSIGWNRRHYEPIPDSSRPQSRGPHGWTQSHRPSSSRSATPRSAFSSAGALTPSRSSELLGEPTMPRSLGHLSPQHGPMRIDAYSEGYFDARGQPPPGSPGALGSPGRGGSRGVSGGGSAISGAGSFESDVSYDPPRLSGVDTASRPPLVVHSQSKIYRPAWIGVKY